MRLNRLANPPQAGQLQSAKIVRMRQLLLFVLALSVLLRLAVALYLGDSTPPAKDETSYSVLAWQLASGEGYSFPTGWYPFTPADTPTSHWSFLYTAFVAALYSTAGPHPLVARLAQALLAGILVPWLTYRLTRRIMAHARGASDSESQAVSLIAAGLAALYAYLALYGAMVQTEAFFICAVLWSLERGLAMEASFEPARGSEGARSIWPTAFSFGLSLGITTLLRQSILPWVAVMFAYLLWSGWRKARSGARVAPPGADHGVVRAFARVVGAMLLAGVVILACIAPFTVRNYRVYGDFLLLNSNAGYAMYSAQHPMHGASFAEYVGAPLPEDLVSKGLNEAQWDKELMRRGIGFVLADPVRYLMLSLSRVRDYFEFWPTADSSTLFNLGRVLSIGVLLPFMIAGIVLAARRCGARLTLLYLFLAFYSLLHIFTWAMARYRLPVDAVALPFAALTIHALADRLLSRRAARPREAAVS
jgi:hypothetical protein